MSGIMGRIRDHFQSTLSANTGHSLTSNPVPTLCTTCAALDLKKILRDGLPEPGKITLGTFLDIKMNSDRCAFCRLVADLIYRRWRLNDFPDTDIQGTTCFVSASACGTLVPKLGEKKKAHRLDIHASRPQNITTALIAAKASLHLDIQLLEEDARKVGRSKDIHGRRIEDKVDIRLIKRWVHLCEKAHGEACGIVWWKSGGDDLPEIVRMVDVDEMALVYPGRDCRYVALSYVWGGPGNDYWTTTKNTSARNRRAGLEESALPATIVDAIELTRQIGERYLWVDALCIIQDSQDDKAAQIVIMDRVYSRAALTIIAADGTTARAGLAGVRTGSRMVDQRIEHVQGLHLAIPLPPLTEVLVDSTWDTRGWTFQEGVLSRRRLYFTRRQMYFECSKDVWCEDLVAESKTLQGSSHPMRYSNTNLFHSVGYKTVSKGERSYANAVEQYTKRYLTVESDIIYAITALTNAMSRALEPPGSDHGNAFRYGMWIRNLDLSLLWQPRLNTAHTRRIMSSPEHSRWPSWAWSGWKGAVQYQVESYMLHGNDQDVHGLPAESFVTKWDLVDEDGTIIRLDVKQIPLSLNPRAEESPPQRYVPSKSDRGDLVVDVLPPRGTLIFRTQCAPFRVLKLDDDEFSDPGRATFHTIFHVTPVGHVPHHYAGRIVLPVCTPSPTILELVVLSRCGGLRGLWDESVWGERYYGCLLHVMAVRRMRDDARVSERVGVGVVVESAWMKSGAEERVVLLA